MILLESDADLDADGDRVDNAASGAAVACVLLEHGADAMAQDKDELTPLRMALGGRHGKVARLFLRNGAPDAGAQDIMHHVSYRFRDNIY